MTFDNFGTNQEDFLSIYESKAYLALSSLKKLYEVAEKLEFSLLDEKDLMLGLFTEVGRMAQLEALKTQIRKELENTKADHVEQEDESMWSKEFKEQSISVPEFNSIDVELINAIENISMKIDKLTKSVDQITKDIEHMSKKIKVFTLEPIPTFDHIGSSSCST